MAKYIYNSKTIVGKMNIPSLVTPKNPGKYVKCRRCKDAFKCSDLCTNNKKMIVCRCQAICQFCLISLIEQNYEQIFDGGEYLYVHCHRCQAKIYFLDNFGSKVKKYSEMESSQFCYIFIVLVIILLILAFGVLAFVSSLGKETLWIGLTMLLLALLGTTSLIKDVVNEQFLRFFIEKSHISRYCLQK